MQNMILHCEIKSERKGRPEAAERVELLADSDAAWLENGI
tara:strand:- start:775 stop:894 length:120 start_codon:yes stop_codon:yes gene_type:complete